MVLYGLDVAVELKQILEALEEKPRGPGDVVSLTGIPRYRVLAYFHLLEFFGFIDKVYSKGLYKVYVLTSLGRELLEGLRKGVEVKIVLEAQPAVPSGQDNVGLEAVG